MTLLKRNQPSAEERTSEAPHLRVADDAPTAQDKQKSRRKRLFGGLALVIAVIAAGYGTWWFLVGSHYVSTDNAYVGASTAQVTPLVSGQVVEVPVNETQTVRKGDVLARLDPADFQLAVDQAKAELGQAERRVRQYFANDAAAAAQTAAREADIARANAQLKSAQADYDRARSELRRREGLAETGAVSGEELTSARTHASAARAAVAAAQAALKQAQAQQISAARQQKAANALVAGTSVDTNPEVALARAKLAKAQLDLDRTVVRAPAAGVVTAKRVEVGQRVQAGETLMRVVPIADAYVDANFKEVQLDHVLPGQPVTLTSDLYGEGVKFHGAVVGFSGGAGSAFSLIPAQNATGNWIKVVQRVPVRISLDPAELAEHPLRVGLSMHATIDISKTPDEPAIEKPNQRS